MLHEPSHARFNESKNATIIKEVVGKWLFFLYAIVYFGFILLNLVAPDFMASYLGVFNMAIIYGFGLILFAIFLAFAYNHICTKAEAMHENETEPSAAEIESESKED